jgi:microcystin-dependent protein
MSQPFVGEIIMAGFNFAPVDWAFCNGAVQAISENPALFQLIGTTFGGDGVETFNLPDLQGRVPIHQGTSPSGFTYVIGQNGGVEEVTITSNTYPNHNHAMFGTSNAGSSNNANSAYPGSGQSIYSSSAPNVALNAAMESSNGGGGGQPHDNTQPFLVINFVIALFGVFPSAS